MPSTTKTNKLITDIAEVLDIEIASQEGISNVSFDVSDLASFELEQGNPINLADDGSGTSHVLQYGITINLDSTAEDYSKVNSSLESSTAMIYDLTRDIIAKYTYAEVKEVDVQRQIKEEILAELRETFGTVCIYSVSFYNWVAQ
jgi:flagellar basal body-associated protein FliL